MEVDQSTLNAYHQERNKAALEEVEEMLKQPCSSEQMLLEIQHRLNK